jgi:phage shock protein C
MTQPKKLTRNLDNNILGGVCSGMATYFNIDISVMRILWALAAILGGWGILLYLICWIVIPVKE